MITRKAKTVMDYINHCPKEVQPALRELRAAIKSAAPHAVEKISYKIPYYAYKGRLAYFAAAKHHIGVYALFPDPKGPLGKYITGKGTMRFPFDTKIPYSLIKKQVQLRAKENELKKK